MSPRENSDQFLNKTFGRELLPMTKENRCSTYTGLSYCIAKEYCPKRAYAWLTNGTRLSTLSNKKQATEAAINWPDVFQRSAYPMEKRNGSLGIYSNCLTVPGQARSELLSRPSPSLFTATDGMSARRNALVNSHNPREILNAKVNDVLNSENLVSAPIRYSFIKVDEGRLLRTTGYNKCYGNFFTSGRPYHGNNTPVDVICNERLLPHLTLGSNNEEETNINLSDKADEEPMKDASRMAIAKNKVILDCRNYTHLSGAFNQTKKSDPYARPNDTHMLVIRDGGCNAYQMLVSNNKDKGDGIVSGEARVSTNGKAITDNQNFAQFSRPTSQVTIVEPNADRAENISNTGGGTKKQKARGRKKLAAASDPSPNRNSLSNRNILATGVFNGAPVKYTLKRRGIILHGTIKGSKILCSCNECNNSEYIGPCKFERHAGGKNKKPYSFIYLENGKSINQVCREIRATPMEMLFERLPEIAGSAFRWLSFKN